MISDATLTKMKSAVAVAVAARVAPKTVAAECLEAFVAEEVGRAEDLSRQAAAARRAAAVFEDLASHARDNAQTARDAIEALADERCPTEEADVAAMRAEIERLRFQVSKLEARVSDVREQRNAAWAEAQAMAAQASSAEPSPPKEPIPLDADPNSERDVAGWGMYVLRLNTLAGPHQSRTERFWAPTDAWALGYADRRREDLSRATGQAWRAEMLRH